MRQGFFICNLRREKNEKDTGIVRSLCSVFHRRNRITMLKLILAKIDFLNLFHISIFTVI